MNPYRTINLAILFCNIGGSLIIFFYFAYVDLRTHGFNKAFWAGDQQDWTVFWTVMLITGVIAVLASGTLARPLRRAAGRVMSMDLRRRALGYPLSLAAVSLLLWLVVGLFFAQGALMPMSTNTVTFWRTFVGIALIGGGTVSVLVYLVTESLWRGQVPVLLHDGERPQRRWRISVSTRLIVTLVFTGLLPLLILMLVTPAETMDGVVDDPEAQLARIERLVLYVVVAALASNLLLGSFLAYGLLHPVRRLTRAMARVAGGDLSVRVPVDSDDELGDMANHFNHMLGEIEQSRQLRDLFGRYVSREVAERALAGGADLGGEVVTATALFADIRGFTSLSEALPARTVVDILNRYYSAMVEVILAEGGFVNKFGGDSLLAIFGAPCEQADHAERAVRAARAMLAALAPFNREQVQLGLPTLRIGIGIASGEMIAGNVGGLARMEYTVIGDPVNLAARLQDLTKQSGQPLLVSEQTHRAMTSGQKALRSLGRVRVRGKTAETLVYTLRDPALSASRAG